MNTCANLSSSPLRLRDDDHENGYNKLMLWDKVGNGSQQQLHTVGQHQTTTSWREKARKGTVAIGGGALVSVGTQSKIVNLDSCVLLS